MSGFDNFAMILGQCVIALAALGALAGVVIGVTLLINRAVWSVVEAYGGIKVLNEYREWHRERRRTSAGKE